MNLPRRPSHWLPGEPAITVMPETDDGFAEVVLELGGRVVATEVVSGGVSMLTTMRRFEAVAKADLDASQ